MTTTAATTTDRSLRAPSRAPRHELAGVGTLVGFMLRRDRVRLIAWVAGFALFVLYVSLAVPAAYPEEDLAEPTTLFADPVGRMLTGPGLGFDEPTHERFVANGYGLYLIVLAALMSILLVVRHTRMEEQSGRVELVRANVVGARAPLTAAMIVATIANVAVVAVIAIVMIGAGGFGARGALVAAASVGAVGLAFAGVAAVTAQVGRYSRAASGLAGSLLGAAFAVRAGGDMAREGGTALSWTSPLAWGQQTGPYVLDRWWPLALPVALAAAGTAAAFALSARRDLGAGLLPDRPGPPRARPSLGTPLGVAARLQRGPIVAWAASIAVSGLVFGAFTDALRDAADDLPDTFVDVFGADDIVAGYVAYIAQFSAFLTGAFAILAVQALRTEETTGRADPLLSTPMSRTRWLGVNLAVAGAAVVAIMALTGIATGIGAALVTDSTGYIGDLTLAHLNQVPAVLVVLGLAALCIGVVPRAIPVTWAVVGYGVFVGTFGALLELPAAVVDLSPFEHPAEMPLEAFDLAPVAVLVALASALAGAGAAGIRRRDIGH